MITAGIDVSTREVMIAVTGFEPRSAQWIACSMHGQWADDRLRTLHETFPSRRWWAEQDIDAVGIERPAGRSAYALHRVMGAVMAMIPQPILITTFGPSEWRKAVGLSGSCSKDTVMDKAKSELRLWRDLLTANGQDKADAFLVALATASLIERKGDDPTGGRAGQSPARTIGVAGA